MRVTQSTAWTFFALQTSQINSQFWTLSLSVINRDAQLVLMVRTYNPPELRGDNFTADFIDLSSWQFNLSSHILRFEPYSLGNSSVYAGVYFYGNSPGSSATYNLQIATSPAAFCPSDCSGQGTCQGGKCSCRPGFVGIDCRIPVLVITKGSVTTTMQSSQWQLVTLQGQSNGNISPARVTITAQASSESLNLHLYMSSAEPGYVLYSGDLFPGDRYCQAKRVMDVSGAMALSLDMQCDCDVYFSIYNAGFGLQVSLQTSISEPGEEEASSQMDTNLPLIAGIGGFFAVAVLGVIVGCVVFVCKRRSMRRAQVQEAVEERGIPQEKVEAMYPQRRFSQLAAFHLSDTCSVCLERFKASSDIRVLSCKHVYHTPCIDLWFRDNHVLDIQVCCLCKQDCQHFTEESEVETSMFDRPTDKALPDVLVESLDDTVVDHEPAFRRGSMHNSYLRK
jgi:hypothetical protein